VENKAEGSVDDLFFTGDGATVVVVDQLKGAYAVSLNSGAKTVTPTFLGKVDSPPQQTTYGPVGADRVFLKTKQTIAIVSANGVGSPLKIRTRRKGFREVVASPDGKSLYVSYLPWGEKPYWEVWDLDGLGNGSVTQPRRFEMGHANPIGNSDRFVRDQLFFPPQSRFIVAAFWGRSHGSAGELRLIDPSTLRTVYTHSLPKDLMFNHMTMASDGSRIVGLQNSHGANTVWHFDLAALLDRVGP
jgi:hypothetical protein